MLHHPNLKKINIALRVIFTFCQNFNIPINLNNYDNLFKKVLLTYWSITNFEFEFELLRTRSFLEFLDNLVFVNNIYCFIQPAYSSFLLHMQQSVLGGIFLMKQSRILIYFYTYVSFLIKTEYFERLSEMMMHIWVAVKLFLQSALPVLFLIFPRFCLFFL